MQIVYLTLLGFYWNLLWEIVTIFQLQNKMFTISCTGKLIRILKKTLKSHLNQLELFFKYAKYWYYEISTFSFLTVYIVSDIQANFLIRAWNYSFWNLKSLWIDWVNIHKKITINYIFTSKTNSRVKQFLNTCTHTHIFILIKAFQ